jgi:arylsulfatase A-like enzyme
MPSSPEHPNLILIVLDTLNASHLGLYGYPRPVSPSLDAFAEHSAVFERAVSSSSWTLPAHATLFTGLFSRAHGADVADTGVTPTVDSVTARPLAPEAETLAEIARKAGLETGAICANSHFLHRSFGLHQGFGTYVDVLPSLAGNEPAGLSFAGRFLKGTLPWLAHRNGKAYLRASEVNALALKWLRDRRDRRFFLFLNYMDTHLPYLPVGPYRRLFPRAWPPATVDRTAIQERQREILSEERQGLVDAYDAELRYLDDHLGVLFGHLGASGLLDRSVVVIVADHGESFGEHHALDHGNGVYETEVRIPLIVRLPGQREGRRVARLVHLVDVMPTILEATGLPRPAELHGDSLWHSERRYPPVSYTDHFRDSSRTHHAIYRDPWKLIRRSDEVVELYNIRDDPEETSDLSGQRADLVVALSRALDAFEQTVVPRFELQPPPQDADLLERLRAIGYIQ